ncbi:MAG: NHL repeat-containing protein [Planctomycetota bacterium]
MWYAPPTCKRGKSQAAAMRTDTSNRRHCLKVAATFGVKATFATGPAIPLSFGALASLMSSAGCVPAAAAGSVQTVWGRRGTSDGRFLKPRAITIDLRDQLYIVDTTGRIQVFDADGRHLRTWSTPLTQNGRPTGLSFAPRDNRLLVADTHYYRMLAFDPMGELLEEHQIGGTAGYQPGQFAFVTDAVTDDRGRVFVGEYGQSDRIQAFSPEGEFLFQFGGTGREPGKFLRPQSLLIDGNELWIADACNHRIARFDVFGDRAQMIDCFGTEGDQPGQFYYPYDLVIDTDGSLMVCEYGNQRIQRLTKTGKPLAIWGGPGAQPGQLYQPWGLVIDSRGRTHVLDSNNHRVQRFVMPTA